MALEASHIRFALDIQNSLEVKDIKSYVVGSIYPDSRYVTKIGRELTHQPDFLTSDFFKVDDFRKGWYAHLLYDKIQKDYTKVCLPEMWQDIGDFHGQGSELWVRLTALKILQDVEDAKAYDIKFYLPYLDNVENPNNEELEVLSEYNRIFQNMYAEPEKVNIDSCYKMWKLFGIGDEMAGQVKKRAEEFQSNTKIMDFIKTVYERTLDTYERNRS